VKKHWLPVGLLALAIFAINALARLVTRLGKFADAGEQEKIGLIAAVAVAVVLIGAGAWWAARSPFVDLVGEMGAAIVIGSLLSLLIGPFIGGSTPFAEGPGLFVGQFLLLAGLAAVGAFLGFMGMVAFGKDWKSKGLARYEKSYSRRPHRSVRG
jgi:hypothetical protein